MTKIKEESKGADGEWELLDQRESKNGIGKGKES